MLRLLPRRVNSVQGRLASTAELKAKYDAVIVGGGHNGLISACYLAEAGKKVAVLEKRPVLGGAAVTEEIVPGWKFSRCSYVLSLLRPHIMKHLDLKSHGLRLHLRNPNGYTPLHESFWATSGGKSLILGRDPAETAASIGQFSAKDAVNYPLFENWLEEVVKCIEPLIDTEPLDVDGFLAASLWRKRQFMDQAVPLYRSMSQMKSFSNFYNLLTAPISQILDQWFEGDVLKATLATDGVIGTMLSPHSPGSGYVLLHHVMGEQEGIAGAWAYPEGGMGAVSEAIASAARQRGVEIFTDCGVEEITTAGGGVTGVVTSEGKEVTADMVLSNCTPKVTYLDLCQRSALPTEFLSRVEGISYESPVTKINVALNGLPNFTANPHTGTEPAPWHRCTIHVNCENVDMVHQSYLDAAAGGVSQKPMIEMTMPSSLDPTIAPEGKHVALLFTQYTPFTPNTGAWNLESREQYAQRVFNTIEEYAPGFKSLIEGYEVLTPDVLEDTFGLTGGNIFHGAMGLDQLYFARMPISSPVKGLFLCGSGTHPGGGVMGSPGELAAKHALKKC